MKHNKTINPDSRIVLTSLSLSANPDKPVIESESGIDGKLNQTSDGRGYCMAHFSDPQNPFATIRTRVLQQQFDANDNPVWKSATPVMLKAWVGKEIPGEFITRDVETYQVSDRDCTTYTAVVLKGENIETIFKGAGHALATDTPLAVVVDEVDANDLADLSEGDAAF
jgi:hypothetical protein